LLSHDSGPVRLLLDRFLPRGALRRDLWVTTADAAAFSVMVGCGETYIPAFALALGMGPVAAGMMASVPVLVGAVFQTITPLAVARVGTNRGWCIACTTVQAFSFVPFMLWAIQGRAELWQLLVAASVYWAAGMAGAPAWNSWMGTLVPSRMRTTYFAQRNRLGQLGVFFGFVIGGVVLQFGERHGRTLAAFAVLFALAGVCRLLSTALLASCREPKRPAAAAGEAAPPALVRRVRNALSAIANAPSGALVAFVCSFAFACQIAGPYFTPYMLRERGFSYGAFMLVVGTSFFARVVSLPALGRLGSRIGSLGLLWLGSLSVLPLALFWIPSSNVWYLVGVQFVAGACWATYELAVVLLFFDAVLHRERTGVVTIYNLGLAVATVAGAATGGILLRSLGEDRNAYMVVFAVSCLLRLATIPLLRRVSVVKEP
jgi:MFS family permease